MTLKASLAFTAQSVGFGDAAGSVPTATLDNFTQAYLMAHVKFVTNSTHLAVVPLWFTGAIARVNNKKIKNYQVLYITLYDIYWLLEKQVL